MRVCLKWQAHVSVKLQTRFKGIGDMDSEWSMFCFVRLARWPLMAVVTRVLVRAAFQEAGGQQRCGARLKKSYRQWFAVLLKQLTTTGRPSVVQLGQSQRQKPVPQRTLMRPCSRTFGWCGEELSHKLPVSSQPSPEIYIWYNLWVLTQRTKLQNCGWNEFPLKGGWGLSLRDKVRRSDIPERLKVKEEPIEVVWESDQDVSWEDVPDASVWEKTSVLTQDML